MNWLASWRITAWRPAFTRKWPATTIGWGLRSARSATWMGTQREQKQALQLKPSMATAHAELGSVHARKESWDDAAGEYREAIRLKPGSAEAHSGVGDALGHLGNWQEEDRRRTNGPSTNAGLGDSAFPACHLLPCFSWICSNAFGLEKRHEQTQSLVFRNDGLRFCIRGGGPNREFKATAQITLHRLGTRG